eukprot:1539931-Rhodomonas_salina.2
MQGCKALSQCNACTLEKRWLSATHAQRVPECSTGWDLASEGAGRGLQAWDKGGSLLRREIGIKTDRTASPGVASAC